MHLYIMKSNQTHWPCEHLYTDCHKKHKMIFGSFVNLLKNMIIGFCWVHTAQKLWLFKQNETNHIQRHSEIHGHHYWYISYAVTLHSTGFFSCWISWFGHSSNTERGWGMVLWSTASSSIWLVQKKKKNRKVLFLAHTQNGEQCRRQRWVCLRFCNASNWPLIQTFPFFHFELILYFSQEPIYCSNQSRIINNKGCLLLTEC